MAAEINLKWKMEQNSNRQAEKCEMSKFELMEGGK